jgi:hypothetical protein
MPVHDWTRVDANVFHHLHQAWITGISFALNDGLLPPDYYAMAERRSAGFEPDILTLKTEPDENDEPLFFDESTNGGTIHGSGLVAMIEPKTGMRVSTDLEFYRRKQNVVAVRRAKGDSLVAMVEIVSKRNKSGQVPIEQFVTKAVRLLTNRIHLLIIDLQPPSPRDLHGIHNKLWEQLSGEESIPPAGKPLTLASYRADSEIDAFVEPTAVGDLLTPMPLFLRPEQYVVIPLEETYQAAWKAVPKRWRDIIES